MVFKALVNNITLLIALSIVYNLIIRRRSASLISRQILSGLLFGVVALAGMLNPFTLAPGLIFDGRSIIISTAGLFGGPLTALITVIISAAYRIWLGGSGAVMGVSVITSSALLGVGYYYLRRRIHDSTRLFHLWAFSMLVHLCMLALMYTLPSSLTLLALQQIGIWVVTLYPAGQVLVCMLFLDQEARQAAEEARERSEQKYRSLYENMRDGFARTALNGKILEFNPAFCEMIGYSPEELIEMTYQDLTPLRYQALEEEIIREQVLPRGYSNLYSKEYLCKDGTLIPVELLTHLTRDEKGQPLSFWATVRDITDRKLAEEKFQKAFLNNPAMLIITEARSGKILEVNDTLLNLIGRQRSEIIGQTIAASGLIHPLARQQLTERLHQQDSVRDFEIDFTRPDGRENNLLISIDRILIGEQEMLLTVAQDISQRRQAERLIQQQKEQLEKQNEELINQHQQLIETQEALRQLNADLEQRVAQRTLQLEVANQELEAFSYSVSHDLRAPLRWLTGFSQILTEEYAGQLGEQGISYVNKIVAASQHMSQLIDALLKLSRVTRNELNIVPIHLSRLAVQISEELSAGDEQRQVEWKIQPGLYADGDATLIKIALQNLLENAWKFTAHQPRARIEFGQTEHNGKRCYFIGDNGVGFDMNYAGKLFSPFQRLHAPKDFEGTGIGLAIVARIIRRHGGAIWVEAAPNQGATFYFTLDAAAQE